MNDPEFKQALSEEEMKQALEVCAQEPIHIPGSIQPHGVMLVLDNRSFKIKAVSENIDHHFDHKLEELLGQPVSTLLGQENTDNLKRIIANKALQPLQFIRFSLNGTLWDANAHLSGEFVVFELEPVAENDPTTNQDYFYDELRQYSLDLQNANNVEALYEVVVDHIRTMTDFDRVKLYQFDDQWNGEVVSESKKKNIASYKGLRFPASDIPKQARELYSKSYLRIITDIRYKPAQIIGTNDIEARLPIDMTHSVLRSVSPVHIQYLENMGVGASMSISILQDGKLWGLVACHHMSAKYIPYRIRMISELMGHIFSTLLTSFTEIEDREDQESRNLLIEKLSSLLHADRDKMPDLLEDKLLLGQKALKAEGMVFRTEGKTKTIGETPDEQTLEDLIHFLQKNYSISLLQTNDAENHFKDEEKLKALTGGILAVPLSHRSDEFVIWFRKPIVETIEWGGTPEKRLEETTAGYRLAPRSSFNLYKETVQHKSRRWNAVDIETAQNVIRLLLEYEKSTAKLQSQYKSEFLANMSHELRTPMNSIVGIANILDKDHQLTDNQKEMIQTLNLSSENLLNLINDLLDLSKIEANSIELENIEFNFAEILEYARSVINVKAQEKGIQLNFSYPTKAELDFYGDPTKLRQIMLNLLSNAVKFTHQGFVNVLLKVHHTEKPDEKQIIIEVSDTGIGMSDSQTKRIFEKFTQADPSTARNYGGTGLGLSITKEFVEMMDGSISVTSRENMGSQFKVEIPLTTTGDRVVQKSQETLQVVKTSDVAKTSTKKRVLLAEDYEGNIVVAIYFLQEMNIETYVVNNGEEAIKAMQEQKFDAVFMDVQMPVMDGLEATRKIREMQKAETLYNCPIIGMTANAFMQDQKRCIDAGMNAYLSKPFSEADLESVVEEYLK